MKSKSYYSINGGSRPELSAIECLQDHVLIHVKSMPIYYIAENMSVKANTLVLILGSDWLDLKTDFGLLSNILCEPEKAPRGGGCTYLPLVWPFQHSSSLAFPAVTLSSTHIASGRFDQNFFDSFSFSFMSTTLITDRSRNGRDNNTV